MAELTIEAKVKHFILVSTDKAVNPILWERPNGFELICQTFSNQK